MKDEVADSGDGDPIAVAQSCQLAGVQLAAVQRGAVPAAQIGDVVGIAVLGDLRVAPADVFVVENQVGVPAAKPRRPTREFDAFSRQRTVFDDEVSCSHV